MPANVPARLSQHLAGELTTLATLWEVTRLDGTVYRFTDHDKPIPYAGNTFTPGIGYDRSAIADKFDLSADNMEINGILSTDQITRADIRAGRFDGASVYLWIVNYQDPAAGAILRRRGWFGEVKQNNLGQFSTELRGMTEALQETVSEVFMPDCRVDLGSTKCGRTVIYGDVPEHAANTSYNVGQEVKVTGITDLLFRCITAGRTAVTTDDYLFDTYLNDTLSDGTVVWQAVPRWDKTGSVIAVQDRRFLSITLDDPETRLATDARHFDQGLIKFTSGNNSGLAYEVKTFNETSSDDADIALYLKAHFDIAVGDTFVLTPGCDKSLSTCNSKFSNSHNFRGFPHVPGDDYLKNYPDPQ